MRNSVIQSQIAGQAFMLHPTVMDSLLSFANSDTPRAVSVQQVANNSVTYENLGSVAVISVDGPMYKKDIGGMCSTVASYDQISKFIDIAENDPNVTTMVFRVDTPGGSVAGADEVGDKIFNSKKHTVCLYENMGASGGIWIFSACDELYATETTMLGSIGVIVSYMEDTAESTVKRVSIVSKNAENKDCSLTGNCKEKLQNMLDTYETMFYNRIERNSGFTADMIKTTFNNGDVIFANSAKDAGFIRDVVTFDSLLTELLGASPTASVGNKSKFNSKGVGMALENSLLGKLQAMLGLQTDKTEAEALSELEMSLETATKALATKTEALSEAEKKVTEAEHYRTEIFTRLAEAKELGVSVDVAIKMLEAPSAIDASKIAIDSKTSIGGTPQVDHYLGVPSDNKMSLMEYAKLNKIK